LDKLQNLLLNHYFHSVELNTTNRNYLFSQHQYNINKLKSHTEQNQQHAQLHTRKILSNDLTKNRE